MKNTKANIKKVIDNLNKHKVNKIRFEKEKFFLNLFCKNIITEQQLQTIKSLGYKVISYHSGNNIISILLKDIKAFGGY